MEIEIGFWAFLKQAYPRPRQSIFSTSQIDCCLLPVVDDCTLDEYVQDATGSFDGTGRKINGKWKLSSRDFRRRVPLQLASCRWKNHVYRRRGEMVAESAEVNRDRFGGDGRGLHPLQISLQSADNQVQFDSQTLC